MKKKLLFTTFVILFCCSGNLHAQKLDLKTAYQRVQEELKQKPDDLNLQMDLAYIYSEGLDFDQAIALYESVLKKDDSNLRATVELCAIYTQEQIKDKALPKCEQATQLSPNNFLLYDNLGLSLFKFGDLTQSLKPFLQALALKSDSSLVKNHVAQAFLALREPDLAREYYQKILKNPDLTDAEKAYLYYGLALSDQALKQYSEAYQAFKATYHFSGNGLFIGKVISAFIAAHQVFFFILVSFIVLSLSQYFGQRLNRFLKNE